MKLAFGLGIAICSLVACRGMGDDRDDSPARIPATPSSGGGGTDAESGGAGGSSDGGQGGAAECGPVDTTNPFGPGTGNPIACQAIDHGAPCALEGGVCASLVCGVGDAGVHHCACQEGTWTCTACFLTDAPWWSEDLIETVEPCATDAADLALCTTPDEVCGPVNGELCLCYETDEAEMIWDCDAVPRCGIIPP